MIEVSPKFDTLRYAQADGFIIMEPGQFFPEGSWQDIYLFPWRM
jgi:hypothetical protein